MPCLVDGVCAAVLRQAWQKAKENEEQSTDVIVNITRMWACSKQLGLEGMSTHGICHNQISVIKFETWMSRPSKLLTMYPASTRTWLHACLLHKQQPTTDLATIVQPPAGDDKTQLTSTSRA